MPQPEKEKRNIGILALFLIGLDQRTISKIYEVSHQRINQILKREFKRMSINEEDR